MPQPITLAAVIPTYNTGDYLRQAVVSLLRQREEGFRLTRIVVVDDRSNDPAALTMLKEVAALDSRVLVLANERRKGSAGGRNHGVLAADAEWIVFLDADDVLMDDGVACRVAALKSHPDATWIGGDFIRCDLTMTPFEAPFLSVKTKPRQVLYATPGDMVRLERPLAAFIEQNLATPSAVMVRRDRLLAAGMFDEDLLRAQDYNLWLRLARDNDYLFVRQPVAYYRIHPQAITESGAPRQWGVRAFEKLRDEPWMSPHRGLLIRRIAHFLVEEARYYRRRGERGKTWRVVRHAWRYALRQPMAALMTAREGVLALLPFGLAQR